jgi:hypothetical protein
LQLSNANRLDGKGMDVVEQEPIYPLAKSWKSISKKPQAVLGL